MLILGSPDILCTAALCFGANHLRLRILCSDEALAVRNVQTVMTFHIYSTVQDRYNGPAHSVFFSLLEAQLCVKIGRPDALCVGHEVAVLGQHVSELRAHPLT